MCIIIIIIVYMCCVVVCVCIAVLPSASNVAYKKSRPDVNANFVAPSATIVGKVRGCSCVCYYLPEMKLKAVHCLIVCLFVCFACLQVAIGKDSAVWYSATLRGDINGITIGDKTVISDRAIVHVTRNTPTKIGSGVVVQGGAMVHGCELQDGW
jgi:hypothetical protein